MINWVLTKINTSTPEAPRPKDYKLKKPYLKITWTGPVIFHSALTVNMCNSILILKKK